MLHTHTLKTNKPKCKEAILNMSWPTKMTKDRPQTFQNKHKSFTKPSLKHARTMVYNLRHVKATKCQYKACMLSKNGVPKPTYNNSFSLKNKHK